ncbi:uncharacterized protein LOC126900031 isoform X12 [Daktulosphaira vitifoliae]|uniref:uncharacterized protein LOC126900031 isoform X12 n=1 Tax=Daktulosphaira vitifoliae TaxID=58002 RepID=UPI0021A9B03F|nr:uncharacterized protein LOC126900031 isoform X12 [Daktulosphaira vitifoliae]
MKTDDSTKLLNTSFKKNIDVDNFTSHIFSSILISINCRYAKLLQIYDCYITIMINECENYYNKKLFYKFIECTKLIQEVVCNSNGMFQTLYDILIFINKLEIKTIFSEYVAPYTIINEIHNVYTYTSSKTKPCASTYITSNGEFDTDDACKDLLNIKHFHIEATNKLHNLPLLDANSNMTSNIFHKYLLEKYNEKYVLQQEIDKSFVQFIYDDLIIFFKINIKNENENFGFKELLHPTVPGLVPPLNVITDRFKIAALNILFAKRYFEPFMNIKIVIENYKKIDAIEVYETMNLGNIKRKYIYFGQLLRCRYVEILKNHHIILAAIISTCRNDHFSITVNHSVYCINRLRNSVSLSVNMFKALLFIMSKLKKLCIWEYNIKAPNCLKKLASIITEYVYDINALNIVLSESKMMNEVEAMTYIDKLYEYFSKLYKGVRNEMSQHLKNRCEFSQGFTHTSTLKSTFSLKILSAVYDFSVFEDICSEMNSFCYKIIENDYEKLGFKDLI